MVIWNQTLIPDSSHLSFPYYFPSEATIGGECDSVFFPATDGEKREVSSRLCPEVSFWLLGVYSPLLSLCSLSASGVTHTDSKVPFTCSLQPPWVHGAASFIYVWPPFSRGVCCVPTQRLDHQCVSKSVVCLREQGWKRRAFFQSHALTFHLVPT